MPWQELTYIGSVGSVFLLQLASPGVGWISLCGWLGLITGPARARTIPKIVIALWWISAVIHFIIQNKFYTYHILPLYAPLALMLAQFFIDEPKTLNRVQITLGFLGIFLVVFPFFYLTFRKNISALGEFLPAATRSKQYIYPMLSVHTIKTWIFRHVQIWK